MVHGWAIFYCMQELSHHYRIQQNFVFLGSMSHVNKNRFALGSCIIIHKLIMVVTIIG